MPVTINGPVELLSANLSGSKVVTDPKIVSFPVPTWYHLADVLDVAMHSR